MTGGEFDADNWLRPYLGKTALRTGKCQKSRCVCTYSSSWGGPRCTTAISSSSSSNGAYFTRNSYGPSTGLSIASAVVMALLLTISLYAAVMREKKAAIKKTNDVKSAVELHSSEKRNSNGLQQVKNGAQESLRDYLSNDLKPKGNYSQNFV